MTDEPNKPPPPARHPLAGALAIGLGILLFAFTLVASDRSRVSPGVHLATLSLKASARLVRASFTAQSAGRPNRATKVASQRLDLLDRSISDLDKEEEGVAANRLGFPFTYLAFVSATLIATGGRLYRGTT